MSLGSEISLLRLTPLIPKVVHVSEIPEEEAAATPWTVAGGLTGLHPPGPYLYEYP